jgi:hypothetical protein
VIYNRDYPDDSSIAGRLSNSVLSLINGEGDVYDSRNIDDTTGVNILTFNFSPPSPSPTQPPTPYEFVCVSAGYCQDFNGEYYDYLEFTQMESLQTCEDTCVLYMGSGFQGFSFDTLNGYCYCWFNDGSLPINNSDISNYSAFIGTGGINGADGNQGVICYKYISYEPSSSPSASPPTKPSSFPSENPSDRPSTSPSVLPSLSPTMSPSEVSVPGSYVFVGDGFCRGIGDYPDFYYTDASSWTVATCDANCLKTPHLLGFSLYPVTSTPYLCYCWYDDGKVPSPLPESSIPVTSYSGTGPLESTDNQSVAVCYAYA